MIQLRPRSAFSLFQLLVVLALLAILFGLFFPLILKARATAARLAKINNLRQLAFACLDYASANEHLPCGNDNNNFSTAAYLLSYLEQDPLFGQLDFKKPITDEKKCEGGRSPTHDLSQSPRRAASRQGEPGCDELPLQRRLKAKPDRQ